MPRKNSIDGKQKSIVLNENLQEKLTQIKDSLGLTTESEAIRFLINDYYARNIDKNK